MSNQTTDRTLCNEPLPELAEEHGTYATDRAKAYGVPADGQEAIRVEARRIFSLVADLTERRHESNEEEVIVEAVRTEAFARIQREGKVDHVLKMACGEHRPWLPFSIRFVVYLILIAQELWFWKAEGIWDDRVIDKAFRVLQARKLRAKDLEEAFAGCDDLLS